MHYTTRREGSALVSVIFIVVIISLVIGSFIRMVMTQVEVANRTFFFNACLDLAESGVEDAIWAINNDDYSTWNTDGTDYWKTLTGFNLDGISNAKTRVVITYLATTPTITSEGSVSLVGGETIEKQIQVELTPRSLFPNGLTAKDTITFAGGHAEVDAYDSNISSIIGNRLDQGTVATLSAVTDAVSIANASIFGYIATGGSNPDIGPNGQIYGADRIYEVEVLHDSTYFVDLDRITNDFRANFEDASAPTVATTPLTSTNATIGDPTGATVEVYSITDLNVQNSDTLNIVGPVIIIASAGVDVQGEINIDPAQGSLELYAAGNVSVTGNGIVNEPAMPTGSPEPNNLLIYGTAPASTGQTIKLAGNGILAAGIYAPNAEVELEGGGASGEMYGAVVAENIKVTGDYEFHYDIQMKKLTHDDSYRMSSWSELIKQSERYAFSSYF